MSVLAPPLRTGPCALEGRGPLAGARRAVAVATVLAAMTLAVLDAGMVNVALPSLALAFEVEPARAILVVTAYQAGLVMALLPMGAMGEGFEHRRVFALSVAVFAAASAMSAIAPNLTWLIVARFIQGLGGAGIMALGVALLRFTLPTGQLGRAIGWNALTVALASAAAPSVGALVVAVAGWPWLFAVTLPVAILTIMGAGMLPATARSATPPDAVSIGLSAAMFAMLILAVQAAASIVATALLAAGLLALGLLIHHERPKAAPLFPLDLLRGESFRLSVLASMACFAAQTAGLVALPFRLQHQLHLAPLSVGLLITVWPLSVAVSASIVGRLAERLPTAWLCAIGASALSVGLAGCGLWPLDTPWALVPFLMLSGFGFGLFQTPNNRNLFLSAPTARAGAAGGLQGTARVSGQTAGALIVTVLFSQMSIDVVLPISFALAAALALIAAIVSLVRIVA